jgi:hypothetical protein
MATNAGPSGAQKTLGDFAPALAGFTNAGWPKMTVAKKVLQ